MSTDILVFPHHGGLPSKADGEAFAYAFCNLIKPKVILFSFDRNRWKNPREEIIKGIRSAVPNAYFVCTQLSRGCADQLPVANFDHLSGLPAKGRGSKSCCGGTIVISINERNTIGTLSFKGHSLFVRNKVPTPLCLKNFNLNSPAFGEEIQ